MVTTRAQSRAKPPLRIELDSPLELRYFSESAAYIVYQIGKPLTRLPFKDEDFDSPPPNDSHRPTVDPSIRGKLLRLRKQHRSATPVLESHTYFRNNIVPLFPPGMLVEQELCEVSPALLKHYNKELRRDEKRQFLRDEGRAGTYLAEEEPHGLLVTSMIYDDQHACCDFKPKWLVQSPFAPEDAKRCRNCAMAAKSGDHDGFMRWCPMVLNRNDEELLKKHLDGAFGNLRGAPIFVPEQVSYAIPFLKQSGMLRRLRELQEEYGTEDLLGEGPPSEKLKLAMTLRDCSMFMKVRREL